VERAAEGHLTQDFASYVAVENLGFVGKCVEVEGEVCHLSTYFERQREWVVEDDLTMHFERQGEGVELTHLATHSERQGEEEDPYLDGKYLGEVVDLMEAEQIVGSDFDLDYVEGVVEDHLAMHFERQGEGMELDFDSKCVAGVKGAHLMTHSER
jgi:hypothetical protein